MTVEPDPAISALIKALGFDPDTTVDLTLKIREGEIVTVETTQSTEQQTTDVLAVVEKYALTCKQPTLEEQRLSIADDIFLGWDFDPPYTESYGWTLDGNYLFRVVWYRDEDEGKAFHVHFKPGSTEVEKVDF